jgi:hypothetical protein
MGERLSVFAVDPGGTTGWAEISVPVESLLDRQVDLFLDLSFDCGQITGDPNSQVEELGGLLWQFKGPVIIEDFILRQFRQDRDLLAPVVVTAKLEYEIFVSNKQRVYQQRVKRQQPSLAKSTATDDRLREWGLWEVGAPHARDSLRHTMTFLRRAKTDRKLLEWGWPSFRGRKH